MKVEAWGLWADLGQQQSAPAKFVMQMPRGKCGACKSALILIHNPSHLLLRDAVQQFLVGGFSLAVIEGCAGAQLERWQPSLACGIQTNCNALIQSRWKNLG